MSLFRGSIAATIVGLSLAGTTLLLGCQSASFRWLPEGGFVLTIVGDDARSVHARGLEDALQQCIRHKASAEDRGDTAAAADWQGIIDNVLSRKESAMSDDEALEAALQTGTVESLDDGSLLWTWNGEDDSSGEG